MELIESLKTIGRRMIGQTAADDQNKDKELKKTTAQNKGFASWEDMMGHLKRTQGNSGLFTPEEANSLIEWDLKSNMKYKGTSPMV